MEGFAPRSLVLLLVTAAVVTAATPAAAQVPPRGPPPSARPQGGVGLRSALRHRRVQARREAGGGVPRHPAISRDPGVRGAGAAPLRRAAHVGVAGQRYSADRRAQRQRCLHERRASAAQRRGPPGTIEAARAAKRSEDGTRSATLQEEATGPRDCGSKRRRREPPPPRGS